MRHLKVAMTLRAVRIHLVDIDNAGCFAASSSSIAVRDLLRKSTTNCTSCRLCTAVHKSRTGQGPAADTSVCNRALHPAHRNPDPLHLRENQVRQDKLWHPSRCNRHPHPVHESPSCPRTSKSAFANSYIERDIPAESMTHPVTPCLWVLPGPIQVGTGSRTSIEIRPSWVTSVTCAKLGVPAVPHAMSVLPLFNRASVIAGAAYTWSGWSNCHAFAPPSESDSVRLEFKRRERLQGRHFHCPTTKCDHRQGRGHRVDHVQAI